MALINFAIRNPVTVLVGVIIVCLFGMISIFALPIQLTPNVDKPEVSITTRWEGASPQEIEREIIEVQEEKLKSLQGLKKMTSTSSEGSGTIILEFILGTNMSRALLDTSDKLRQVKKYPENVDQPFIETGASRPSNAISWFILKSHPPREDISTLYDLMDNVVKPRMERVSGVSSINLFGGVEKEVHVKIDPYRLAQKGLSMMNVRDMLRRHNTNISGGDIEQGKRSYIVRTVGQYPSLQSIMDSVIRREGDDVVYLKDIGVADYGYKEPQRVVRSQGNSTIAMNAIRQTGSNVMEVMAGLKEALKKVNEEILNPMNLEIVQVYDETLYIDQAINLVIQNLYVGGFLALCILLLFLRNIESTLIVAIAIPISVIGTFLFLVGFGRNLNVVSLAGIAFAVGMVVDNSIVVLENIYRHLQKGEKPFDAALKGGMEVWGAVLASTLTTMAVFIPVLFIREEAGQLFRDIAVAVSSAVGLSLIVSVFFIPMAAARLHKTNSNNKTNIFKNLFGIVALASYFAESIAGIIRKINRSVFLRLMTVGGLTVISVFLSIKLIPPMGYLPEGNQNMVIGILIPPPGYSKEEFIKMGKKIEKKLLPYWKAELNSPEAKKLGDIPPIKHFFYVARGQNVFMGLISKNVNVVKPLAGLVKKSTSDIPGVFSFSFQRSLFERGLAAGSSVDVEITGMDMESIKQTAGMLIMEITKIFGFPRPDPPNFNLGGQEIQFLPKEDKSAEFGLSVEDVGFIVQTAVDGVVIGDYWDKGDKIDLKLISSAESVKYLEDLDSIPVATPSGKLVPLSSFVDKRRIESPTQINRIEERKAVKLVVSPPKDMELETAMTKLENDIIIPMRNKNMLPSNVDIVLAGTADKLKSTREALKWNFILALLITYLLMSSLFESFLYPIVIMFSVPLAAVGGFAGFNFVHKYTGMHLDIITMLGFILLIGTVVNGAILIVHQTLNFIRHHEMSSEDAIVESVKTRVRPIFMSMLTSIGGMAPLVLFPGAGSELYRGVGSVVIGGLAVSTVFTLFVVPTLFSLVLSVWKIK